MAAGYSPFGVNYFAPPPETKQTQRLNNIAIGSNQEGGPSITPQWIHPP